MAINFLNTVDFNKNQLDYAAIQNIGSNPTGTAVEGQIYFNTHGICLNDIREWFMGGSRCY
jgi:hypothetical protein